MSIRIVSSACPSFVKRFALGVTCSLSLLLLHAAASAQECQNDQDCGFGFQCYEDAPTSADTSGGAAAVCGDEVCDPSEDADNCAEDCSTYCDGAVCESDVDCADGWECKWAGTSDAGTTAGTGTTGGGGWCGDDTCDADESLDTCPKDCDPNRTCQVALRLCNDDADCAAGFYCDDERSGVSAATSSDGGIVTYDGFCELLGQGSGGTGGAGSGGMGGAAEADSSVGGGSPTQSTSVTGGSPTAQGGASSASGGVNVSTTGLTASSSDGSGEASSDGSGDASNNGGGIGGSSESSSGSGSGDFGSDGGSGGNAAASDGVPVDSGGAVEDDSSPTAASGSASGTGGTAGYPAEGDGDALAESRGGCSFESGGPLGGPPLWAMLAGLSGAFAWKRRRGSGGLAQ